MAESESGGASDVSDGGPPAPPLESDARRNLFQTRMGKEHPLVRMWGQFRELLVEPSVTVLSDSEDAEPCVSDVSKWVAAILDVAHLDSSEFGWSIRALNWSRKGQASQNAGVVYGFTLFVRTERLAPGRYGDDSDCREMLIQSFMTHAAVSQPHRFLNVGVKANSSVVDDTNGFSCGATDVAYFDDVVASAAEKQGLRGQHRQSTDWLDSTTNFLSLQLVIPVHRNDEEQEQDRREAHPLGEASLGNVLGDWPERFIVIDLDRRLHLCPELKPLELEARTFIQQVEREREAC